MSKNEQKYKIEDAIKKVKETSKVKFDATVELHINLDVDPRNQEQQIRYTTMLPHGTGKTVKVAVFASSPVKNADLELTEADLKKITSGELKPGADFDVVVAEPKTMGMLATVARTLGPAGVMPNPKNGTVTDDIENAVEQIKKGKVELRTEQIHPIIHTIIGKVSFDDKKLLENYKEIMSSLRSHKPQKSKPDFIVSAFVCASMGGSYQIELN